MSDIPVLLTLTLHPGVDVCYDVARLVDDQKIDASGYRCDPGGNGINVARALTRLGLSAHAYFVAAGEVGDLLERLVARQIARPHAYRVPGETRINTTIEQLEPRAQFEIIGRGPEVPPATLRAICDDVIARADGGFVALTGSLPPGAPPDTYVQLMRALAGRARVVVDMKGTLLASAVAERPFLIKPNRREFEQLVGRPLPTLADVRAAALDLVDRGVQQVCVSLGADGALLADADGARHASAPRVRVASTVGSGDSMVAGLIAGFARGADSADALRLALACGSGTAAQPGTELFDPSGLDALAAAVRIEPAP